MGATESGLVQPASVAEAQEASIVQWAVSVFFFANTYVPRETTYNKIYPIWVELGMSKNNSDCSPK